MKSQKLADEVTRIARYYGTEQPVIVEGYDHWEGTPLRYEIQQVTTDFDSDGNRKVFIRCLQSK